MPKLLYRKKTKWILDNAVVPAEYGRPYLGMSGTGEPCLRRRWYDFHWVSKIKIRRRTQRIFNVGHLFESVAISELKAAGLEVYKIVDGKHVEMTGALDEDQETLMGFFGHVSGHSDGRIKGLIEYPDEEMLLELKTMKEVYFIKLKKVGVKESDPKYYAQVQRYMREKKLKRAFFLAINKNTCEYHTEFIEFDATFAEILVKRENSIIMSDRPPDKEYVEGYYRCIGCNHNKTCHLGDEPEANCRTCEFVDIAENASWICTNNAAVDLLSDGRCEDDYSLSIEEQKSGCIFYKKGWGL